MAQITGILHQIRYWPFALLTGWLLLERKANAVVVDVDIGYAGRGDQVISAEEKSGMTLAWEAFFTQWKTFIAFIAGLGALTSVLVFIFLMLKLGKSGDNPMERSKIMRDLMICLLVTALLGSSSLIFALFVETVTLPN